MTDPVAVPLAPGLTDSPVMANSGLWVGVLTALTAPGAGCIAARAALRAAPAQARTTARAGALREQRDRRRVAHRETMSCAHAFSAVTWESDGADAARDRESGERLLEQVHERIGPAVGDRNRAMHEARLDGPAEVSAAADRVRDMARRLQPPLKALADDDGPVGGPKTTPPSGGSGRRTSRSSAWPERPWKSRKRTGSPPGPDAGSVKVRRAARS